MPYHVDYGYSDIIMRKLLNANRSFKLTLLYFFFVAVTSFGGYIAGSIIKDPGYQKSFIISFIISFLTGFLLFVFYVIS
jgi:hypothetical protein